MKKVIAALFLMLALTGCTTAELGSNEKPESNSKKTDSEFETVGAGYECIVVYHKGTGVMYAVSNTPSCRGVYTVMLDRYGKPLVYSGK